jgi:predicted Ser/Thr protein kinase
MIAITCDGCRQKMKVKDELAGKTGKCPRCGKSLRIPDDQPPANMNEAPTLPPDALPRTATFDTATDSKAPPGLKFNSPELVDFLAPPQGEGEIGRLGPYRILKVLGAGGMGVVYQGEDPHLERAVALKAMLPSLGASPSARERFLREARSAAKVKHDHVVTIYQVGEDNGVPFLAMEFLEGEPLDERLKREAKLPLAEVLRIGREITAGLQAAHEKGLIHRDIKPANIWLEGKQGRVKILDFGLARAARGEGGLTQAGAIIGTPAFMAPEQARGEELDARADLFSLGCVLYRMCGGEQPFSGPDSISTLLAVASEDPRPLRSLNPTLPAGLERLVHRLLAKKRDERPASTQEVARELAALASKRAGEAPPAAAVIPPPPTRRAKAEKPARTEVEEPARPKARKKGAQGRSWLPLAGIGAGVLLVLGGGLLAWQLTRTRNKGGAVTGGAVTKTKGLKGGPDKDGGKDGGKPPEIPVIQPEAKEEFFNGKDLTGWEGLSGHWSVKDGALVGATPAGLKFNTFLCSKKKYRNFELKFEVRLSGGEKANSGVQIRSTLIDPKNFVVRGPQADMGTGYWGSLYGEGGGGMIKAASPAISQAIKANDFNLYFIRCIDQHVTIQVNGKTAVDAIFPVLPAEGIIAWQLHAGPPMEVAFRKIEFTDLSTEGPWVPLFNGKDLTGWKTHPKQPGGWSVEGGMLVGRSAGATHLFSERSDFENFHLRARVRINHHGNSGIYFRSNFGVDRGRFPTGYEAQILHSYPVPNMPLTGSLVGGGRGFPKVTREVAKADQWFTMEVIAKDNHITIKVDGETTVDFVDKENTYRRGHIALQAMSDNRVKTTTVVEFQTIEIIEFPGREGPWGDISDVKIAKPEDKVDAPSTPPPLGAKVLFDGKSLEGWIHTNGTPATWTLLPGGVMQVRGGNIRTKERFSRRFKLHVEFRVPYLPHQKGQGRGNSGVFPQGRYEVQILDSYGLRTSNQECGAIYGVAAPQVNACKAPTVWQSYDIDFTAPVYKGGRRVEGAKFTIHHNGVLIHDNFTLPLPIDRTLQAMNDHPSRPGPIMLQDHGAPVQFRNIWLLPLE